MFFFNKKHTIAASGILQGAADHHSHILPGVDDGVETMDEALRILATYEALGIKELWLTPHIMEDIPNSAEKLATRFDELKAAYSGNIQLHLAAEYMIDNHLRQLLQETNKLRHSQCEGRWHEQSEVTEGSKAPNAEGDKTSESQGKILLINNCPSCVRGASNAVAEGDKATESQGEISLINNCPSCVRGASNAVAEGDKASEPQGKILLINNCPSCVRGASDAVAEGDPPLLPIGTAGKHILVETSYYNSPMRMDETLQQIKSLGYFPLLAHPERYMYLSNADYTKLHSQGVKFQLNLASLAGGYGKTVKKKAEWLLSNGLYSAAGTDLHCEDAIEYITNCKLSKQTIEQVERLLHNSI
jgi:tyrosine-protein phosphatase YwqE